MLFIGVVVEQETSAPPPKKNPGSAPAYNPKIIWGNEEDPKNELKAAEVLFRQL